jgi:3-oxoacyl-[acyl-carrier protein] reductase
MSAKNIVIIGGSRGIGKELCLLLAKNNKVLALSRNITGLEEIKNQAPENIQIAQLDLLSENVKEQLTTSINQYFKTVDILINNAGYLINKPLLETTEADIRDVYTTNVFGLIACSQAVIPFMDNGGHIVNISSIGGVQGSVKFPGISIYSSSKAAVAGFSECLAVELEDKNIQVNCLALGAVQTEMLAEAFPDYQAPMGPEKMAEYIAEFALKSNQWFNGKIIPISISTP